ncbi:MULTISPECIES: chemotaxis protein CheW [Bacillus]|uniref:chemotaxis protein CheW n=1 Tax=Bacillus TaxID=1386 RepID=UPI000BB7B865|nr:MULTISPECIES: chemotaxis protein CheW [Bacillus]
MIEEKYIKIIAFELNSEEYAIPVEQVRSIEKLQPITRVPKTPSYVKGVINLRGVITPIIDLRIRFNLEKLDYSSSTRILMTTIDDMEVGFIVDGANDVIDVKNEQIENTPEVIDSVENKYVNGVVKIDTRILVYLDLNNILTSDKEISKVLA